MASSRPVLSRYNAAGGQSVQRRHSAMRAIPVVNAFVRCVRLQQRARPALGRTVARGKALTVAGDCASCHTARSRKTFAGANGSTRRLAASIRPI